MKDAIICYTCVYCEVLTPVNKMKSRRMCNKCKYQRNKETFKRVQKKYYEKNKNDKCVYQQEYRKKQREEKKKQNEKICEMYNEEHDEEHNCKYKRYYDRRIKVPPRRGTLLCTI